MPVYNVRTKRGTIIPVEAPEGTPQEDIFQAAAHMEADQNLAARQSTLSQPTGSDYVRGIKQHIYGVPGDLGALQVLKGKLTDNKEAMRAGVARMEASEEDVAGLGTKPWDTGREAVKAGVVPFVTDYVPLLAGQVTGLFMEMIGLTVGASVLAGPAGTVTGVTALVGKGLLKKGIKGEARKIAKEEGIENAKAYVAKEVSTELARLQGTKEGKRRINKELSKIAKPATAGVVYSSWGAGETMGRVVEEIGTQTDDPEEQLRLLQEKSGSKLALVSGAHAIANFIGYKIFGKSMEGLTKPQRSYLLNIAKLHTVATIQENPVEVLQTALERYAADLDLTSKEAIGEYIDAMIAATVMPLLPSTIGGIRSGRAPKETKDETTKTDDTKVTDEIVVDEGQRPPESQAEINAQILSNPELQTEIDELNSSLETTGNPETTAGIEELIVVNEAEQARRAADPDLYEDYEPQPLPTSVETPRPETPVVEEAVETTTFVNPEFEGRTQGDIQAELNNAMLARDATDDFGNVEDPTVTDYIEELEQELADRQLVEQDAEIIKQEDAQETEAGPKSIRDIVRGVPNEHVQTVLDKYDAYDAQDRKAGTAETFRDAIDEPITKKSLLENGFKKGWPEYKSAPVGLLSDPQNYLYYEKLANKQVNISDIDAVQEQRLNNVIDASNKTLNSVERPTDAIIDYRIGNEPEVSRETIEQQEGEKHNAREQRRSAFNARVSQPDAGTTGEGSAISRKPESRDTPEGTKEFDRAGVDGGPPDLPATTGRTGELATPLRGEELEKEVKAFGQRLKNLLSNPGLLRQRHIYGTTEYKLISAYENNLKLFRVFQAENPRTIGEALTLLIKNRKITDPATTELVTAFRNAKNIQDVPFTFGPMPQDNPGAAGYYDPEGKYIVINDEESVWNGSNADSWIKALIQVSEGSRDIRQLKFKGQPVDFYLSPIGSKNTLNSTQLDTLAYLPNTILHEVRHALTIESLNEHVNDNLTPKRGSKIGEDAIKIFNAYRQAYPYTYASDNIRDFFAEATSSNTIITQLSSLPSVIKRQKTRKSLLDNVIFVLKQLLGIKTSDTLFADFLALSPHFELGIEAFDVDAAYQKERDLFTRKTIPDKYGSSLGPVNTLQETDPEVVEMLERKELPGTAEALKKTATDKVRRNLDKASGRQQESIREDGVPPTQPEFAATPTGVSVEYSKERLKEQAWKLYRLEADKYFNNKELKLLNIELDQVQKDFQSAVRSDYHPKQKYETGKSERERYERNTQAINKKIKTVERNLSSITDKKIKEVKNSIHNDIWMGYIPELTGETFTEPVTIPIVKEEYNWLKAKYNFDWFFDRATPKNIKDIPAGMDLKPLPYMPTLKVTENSITMSPEDALIFDATLKEYYHFYNRRAERKDTPKRFKRTDKTEAPITSEFLSGDTQLGLQFAATPTGPIVEANVINQAGKIPDGPTSTDEIAEANKTSTQKVNPQNYRELLDLSGQVVQSQPVYSKGLMQGIRDTLSKLTSWAQKYYVQFLSLPQIQELFPDLPGVKLLQDNLEKRANDLWKKSDSLSAEMKAMKVIVNKYRESPEYDKWNKITFELSRQDIHPGLVENKDHGLVIEFKKLPQELQDLAIGMNKDYMKRAKETLDALEKIGGRDITDLRKHFKDRSLKFYQPFMRDGEYWFDYLINTVDSDGKPGQDTVVIAAQTPAERERLIAEAEAKKDFAGGLGKDGKIKRYERPSPTKDSAPDKEMYNFTQEILSKAKIDKEIKEDLQDKLHEHFLSLFRSDSVQAASKHRHGFSGFIEDLEWAYGNASYRAIKNINDLTYLPDIKSSLNEIKNNVGKEGEPEGYRKGVYEAINNRASFYLNPTAEKWASTAGFLSYAWYIGGNLSSAFVNLTQMPIVVAPMLGLEYGMGKAVSALEGARKLYFNGDMESKASLRKKESWKTDDMPDYTMVEGFNAEQKEKYSGLFKRADQTMTLTRGLIHENIDFNTSTKVGQTANLVNQALGWTFKNSERANRELTLVAAFDLAVEAGDSEQMAIDKAIKLTVKAHSHALPEVGPLIFQSGIGKVAFTFKRFAQAQIYLVSQLLGRSFNLAYHITGDKKRKLTNKEKNIARTQLLGISGAAYMFAGVQGLPFYGLADALASLIIDDDEEPFLLDDWVKQSVGQIGYKGPLSYAFNVDIASRTGFRGLMWRADRRRREEVGEAVYIAEHFLGPSWSILTGINRGAEDINNGNIIRGVEQMIPTWARNGVKTFRFATEGATTRKGLKIVDDPNAYNLFMQAFGFSDADLSAAYERVSVMKFKEGKIEGLRSRLLLNYYLATVAGDGNGMNKIQKRINSFNMKNPEVAISGKTLTSSRKTYQRKAQEAVHGVTLNPKMKDRLMEETDYDDDDSWFYND